MRIGIADLLVRPNRRKSPREVEEELRFHIEMLERKYAQQGMSTANARAAALKRFGNVERVRRQCVNITSRSSLLTRLLKLSAILLALTGLSIRILSVDYKITRIGTMLITIAISGRLLLYVR